MFKFIFIFLIPLAVVAQEVTQDAQSGETEQKYLDLESELSIVGAGGNSDFQTYNLKTKGSLNIFKNIISLSGHYTLGTAGGVESARNWDAKFRYDRKLPYDMTGYLSYQLEADEFAGIELRKNLELGASKFLVKEKEFDLKAEFAYRYSDEDGIVADLKQSLMRFSIETNKKISKSATMSFWLEYLPNLSDSENYLVSFSPSLLMQVSERLSLKFGYTGRYDNVPAKLGNKQFDFTYTTSLIAKF